MWWIWFFNQVSFAMTSVNLYLYWLSFTGQNVIKYVTFSLTDTFLHAYDRGLLLIPSCHPLLTHAHSLFHAVIVWGCQLFSSVQQHSDTPSLLAYQLAADFKMYVSTHSFAWADLGFRGLTGHHHHHCVWTQRRGLSCSCCLLGQLPLNHQIPL